MEIRLVKFSGLLSSYMWHWRVIAHTGWVVAQGWATTDGEAKLAAITYAATLIPEEAEAWLNDERQAVTRVKRS